MRHLRQSCAIVACVVSLALAGCGGGGGDKGSTAQQSGASAEGFVAGKTAPGFTLLDVDGKTVHLADYKGKVVVVDFWATWCGPCKAAIPHLIALQTQFAARDFVILGLSGDEDPPATVKQFAQAKGMQYPILMVDQDTQGKYGVNSYPTAFVIDKSGVIRNVFMGYSDQVPVQMESAIRSLL